MNKSFLQRMLRLLANSSIVSCLAILPGILLAQAPPADQAGLPSMPDGAAAGSEYSPESREFHLKAAFLRYVAKFVEWPESSLPESTINICVLGQVTSFQGLNSINNKTVGDRILSVSKITKVEEAFDHCQILFVAKTEQDKVPSIIDAIRNKPILGFGDMDGFAEAGGAMNFYIVNNRLAIMTNLPAVQKAGLKVNPRMLRLVTIIPAIDQGAEEPVKEPAKAKN